MQITVTLFVQAMHFGIAYLMLRAFVFKPFVRILEGQESFKEELQKTVVLEEQSYVLQKEEKHASFMQLKNQLLARIPVFDKDAPTCEVTHIQHVDVRYELSQKEKEDIKKKALDLLR